MNTITIEVREGRTVAGSDYTKPGKPIWRATTYVGRFVVDTNESRISEEDARAKSQRRVDRWGDGWLGTYGDLA